MFTAGHPEECYSLINIHLRLSWEMTTVSVMFRTKGHLLGIIWHPGHLITDEASTPDHISVF